MEYVGVRYSHNNHGLIVYGLCICYCVTDINIEQLILMCVNWEGTVYNLCKLALIAG
jgi:hypothetical protein